MSSFSEWLPEYALKSGAAGVLAVWLFTINARLNDVEQRLYNCLESKAYKTTSIQTPVNNECSDAHWSQQYALRSDELRIKKEKSNGLL